DISINEPAIELESSQATTGVDADDAEGIAEAAIDRWLAAKRAAYSSERDTSELENAISGQFLSGVQNDMRAAEESGSYVEYTHSSVRILSVSPENAEGADSLTVSAEVTESADGYDAGGRVDYSYTDDVINVTYELVREGDQWLIDRTR
ncbi:MAG: ARC6/PARC6 family protein, partial [Cyanobacteria bacterium J06576_12]